MRIVILLPLLLVTMSCASPRIDQIRAVELARTASTSTTPTMVLEVRQGTVRDLMEGPGVTIRGSTEEERERHLRRPAWLVVLVGRYEEGCPGALRRQPCPISEGREEILLDAETGEGISTRLLVPAPGGLPPISRDSSCPPGRECGEP